MPLTLCHLLSFQLHFMLPLLKSTHSIKKFKCGADIRCSQYSCRMEIKMSNLSIISKELISPLIARLQMAVNLAQEKGTSSWLTALPIQEHGFSLHLEMLLLYDMAGCHPVYTYSLCLWLIFLCRSCFVREDFHQLETLLLSC